MSTLILVPGLACNEVLWRPQIDALSAGHDVVVSDATVHGGSIDDMAERLLAAAPSRFSLAGLSMGGYVAMAVVRQAPDRVERLALLDTTARPDQPEQTRFREDLIARTRAGAFDQVLDTLLPLFLGDAAAANAELVARVRGMGEAIGPERFVAQQRAIMSRPDARARLCQTQCPTLVLCGQQDRLTPPDLAQEMTACIANAHLRLLPDCGHLSTLEQPGPVNQALTEWLGTDS